MYRMFIFVGAIVLLVFAGVAVLLAFEVLPPLMHPLATILRATRPTKKMVNHFFIGTPLEFSELITQPEINTLVVLKPPKI